MNKKLAKIFCLALALLLLVTTLATTVFAKEYYYGKGDDCIEVETGRKPWYSVLSPKITIKNEGKSSITVLVLNSEGDVVSHMETLKAGRSFSPRWLKCNETYQILISRHWTGGSSPVYSITEGRYIDYIG